MVLLDVSKLKNFINKGKNMKNIILWILSLLVFNSAFSADVKITSLPAGSGASVSSLDVFPYVAVSSGITKKLTIYDLINVPAIVATYAPKASPTFTGTVTAPSFVGSLTGNASTATALAANPTDCSAGQYASAIAANGNLTCSAVGGTQLTGVVPVANGGTNSSITLNNNRVMQSSGGAVVEAAAITASRALVSDSNGIPTQSVTTATELSYVNGATSNLQTQINTVAASAASSASYNIINVGLSASVGSSALTIALKQADGSTNCSTGTAVCKISFRSSTLSSGLYNERSVTGALSIVISSGSTLGFSSANAHNIYVYAIDNAGTVELAVSQTPYPETGLVSTTAEGGAGAADSSYVMYSTTARSNVPFRMIGKITATEATAGTWATAPSAIRVGNYGTLSSPRNVVFFGKGSNSTAIGGATNVDFSSIRDPLNLWNSGSRYWVVPLSENYIVSGNLRCNTTTTATVNQICAAYIQINGSSQAQGFKFVESTGVQSWTVPVSYSGYLNQGDTIALTSESNITTPELGNGTKDTYLSITIAP